MKKQSGIQAILQFSFRPPLNLCSLPLSTLKNNLLRQQIKHQHWFKIKIKTFIETHLIGTVIPHKPIPIRKRCLTQPFSLYVPPFKVRNSQF